MSFPQSSAGLDQLLRLSGGLKNVAGRRRVLGDMPILDQMTPPEMDVEGLGDASEEPNLPQEELGGELTPQSYDVRANSVLEEEGASDEQKPHVLTQLGQALPRTVEQAETPQQQVTPLAPPIETKEVQAEEGLPEVSASQEVAAKQASPVEDKWGLKQLGAYLKSAIGGPPVGKDAAPMPGETSEQRQDIYKRMYEDLGWLDPSRTPEEQAAFEEQERQRIAQDHADFDAKIAAAQSASEPTPVSGAVNKVLTDPTLVEPLSQATGMDFYDKNVQDNLMAAEAVITGDEEAMLSQRPELEEQIRSLKQRIQSGFTTEMDKIWIGFSLLMPLIVGGFLGAEAGIDTLAGMTQGLSEGFGERDKRDREQLKNLESMMPYEAPGKKVRFVDEESGEEKSGTLIKPGLVARPEFVTTEEGYKDMLKEAKEINEVKKYTTQLTNLSDDIIEIVSKVKDNGLISKAMIASIKGQLPQGYLSKLSDEIEFDGKKQNAGILLENKIGLLNSLYVRSQKLGQLDRAVQDHVKSILSNPTNTLATPRDLIHQIESIRNMSQEGLVSDLENRGFYSDEISKGFSESNARVNKYLQRKEDEKLASELLR